MASVLDSVRNIVGAENLLEDARSLEIYGTDWTRFYTPAPMAAVTIRNVPMLLELVALANRERLALVPSGGRTGLSAGAVAPAGEIVVSFEKMDSILAFDPIDRVVSVEPGVVTASLQRFATDQGLFYPVDFASSGSSQIGGNIATNAGGIKVLRYGMTRDQVVGIKVVTGAGKLLDLNRGLIKNATGYDFRHLFIGSEGTLGFIVEASIALTSPPESPAVILLGVPQMTEMIEVMRRFRERVPLQAFEFFSEPALQHVMARHGRVRPLASVSAYYALLEFEQRSPQAMDAAMAAFQACMDEGIVMDGVVSQSEQQRLDLWQYRELVSESISPRIPYKNDIAVRISKVPQFLAAVERKVAERYPDFEIIWFGHIGDGNVHLNILKPEDWEIPDFKRECEVVSEDIMAIVQAFDGSISAEHGVGLLKRDQLKYSRSEEEILLMRSLKQVFDPNNIMNPGKLLS